jgi:hypothetical protein
VNNAEFWLTAPSVVTDSVDSVLGVGVNNLAGSARSFPTETQVMELLGAHSKLIARAKYSRDAMRDGSDWTNRLQPSTHEVFLWKLRPFRSDHHLGLHLDDLTGGTWTFSSLYAGHYRLRLKFFAPHQSGRWSGTVVVSTAMFEIRS